MTDTRTVQIVAIGLIAVVILALAGGIVLTAFDKEMPVALVGLGTTALGAVAALLVSTKTQPGPEVELAKQAGRGDAIEEVSMLTDPKLGKLAGIKKAASKAASDAGAITLEGVAVVFVLICLGLLILHVAGLI